MCHPSQTGFDATQNDRSFLISLPDQIPVDNAGIIRPLSHNTSGCVSIGLPSLFGYGIMVDHGIHISCGYKKSKTWFAKNRDAVRCLPVRLCNDSHSVATGFQQPCDDGMTKGRMVYISISGNIDKIDLIPSTFFHFFSADR